MRQLTSEPPSTSRYHVVDRHDGPVELGPLSTRPLALAAGHRLTDEFASRWVDRFRRMLLWLLAWGAMIWSLSDDVLALRALHTGAARDPR